MKRPLLLSILIVVLFAGNSAAFDGNRKGFTWGAGIGFSPSISWSHTHSPYPLGGAENSGSGLATVLQFGYAHDEFNEFLVHADFTSFKSTEYQSESGQQGFVGPVWNHYFGQKGHALFTAFGFGFYRFRVEQSVDRWGRGLLFGGGYEFARQVQIGCYLTSGKTTAAAGPEFQHRSIFMVLQVTAY